MNKIDPIYAIRVIGTKFTFYKTCVPLEYLVSLGNGFPETEMVILRKGGNCCTSEVPGFDYKEPDQRLMILRILCGIRVSYETELQTVLQT